MTALDVEDAAKHPPKAPLFHPLQRRFHMILLLMAGFCCTNFMRASLAMTMTCMVNSTAVAMKEEAEYGVKEELLSSANSSLGNGPTCSREQQEGHQIVVDYGGSLIWDHKIQNLMFSGTFWGAIFTVLPSMFFIQRGSPRMVFLYSVATYALTAVTVPFLAKTFGYESVFISRVVMGFGEGFVLPTINTLVGNWFPITERSTAIALYTTGNSMAVAGGNPIVALLCKSSWGWEGVFYLSGVVGFVWMILWYFTSANQPSKCKVMTEQERKYLEVGCVKRSNKVNKGQSIPYRAIITSPPFLAQLTCQYIVSMVASMLQLFLPTYFKDVLLLGVVMNGFFTAIPNIANFAFKLGWSLSMDRMKATKTLTPTQAVRLSQTVSCLGQASTLFGLAFFVDCSTPITALVLVAINVSLMGCSTSGYLTSMLSMAPRYTPTLASISMFIAMLGRLSAPYGVGLLKKTGTVAEWRAIFACSGVLLMLAGIAFVFFGSGEVQPWGEEDSVMETNGKSINQKQEQIVLVESNGKEHE